MYTASAVTVIDQMSAAYPLSSAVTFGFHAVAAPLVASSAARQLRCWPPMEVNEPPTYTVEPDTAMLDGGALGSGSHPVTDPSDVFSAAANLRDWPPIVSNTPVT